jgi:hypothetical protein
VVDADREFYKTLLFPVAQHVIDGEAFHRSGSGVVAHLYLADDEVAAAHRGLGMASGVPLKSGPSEARSGFA